MPTSEKVKRWWPMLDKWCVELQVSQSFVMAVIHAESSGNPDAMRYEPDFERRYITNNPTWRQRCVELGMTPREVATSYGLMQLMFSTAYGYGCRSVKQALDPDQNMRFGIAHLAAMINLHGGKEAALAAYNGGGGGVTDLRAGRDTAAVRYSKKVMELYQKYRAEALTVQPQTAAKLIVPQRNYFATAEFACKCGCGLSKPDPKLIATLNIIREALGSAIIVTSGHRCQSHNRAVGGVANSNHTTGAAADIVSRNAKADDVWALARRLWAAGSLPELAGLGRYRTFTHVDIAPRVAGRLREWDER